MCYPNETDSPLSYFERARESVQASSFAGELDWQRSVQTSSSSEDSFLRETAWVIINSGFREITARRLFPHITFAFFDWRSASLIANQSETCVEIASCAFRHDNKLRAVVGAAETVDALGMEIVKRFLKDDPIEFLGSFSYIGPITVWHLAKNLGCDVAKPDRHLVRLAAHFGYNCVQRFCTDIARIADEKVSVVDLILWRYVASLK